MQTLKSHSAGLYAEGNGRIGWGMWAKPYGADISV